VLSNVEVSTRRRRGRRRRRRSVAGEVVMDRTTWASLLVRSGTATAGG